MSEKENKKVNDAQDTRENEGEVEGYAYCATKKQKCLNDCVIVDGPFFSELD